MIRLMHVNVTFEETGSAGYLKQASIASTGCFELYYRSIGNFLSTWKTYAISYQLKHQQHKKNEQKTWGED